MRGLRSNKKFAAGRRQDTHILSNEEKKTWIEDYLERETAVAKTRVEDAETAIQQEQDDMRNVEKVGLTTTKPETTFEEMLNTIGDSLCNLASSDDGAHGEDHDDDEEKPVAGKVSEDDESGWAMGTIPETVHQRLERFRQKQMKLDQLKQPGGGDAADYIHERDKKSGTTELNVPAVVQPKTADDAASSVPTTFSEPLDTIDSVPGELEMPQVTSLPGSGHMRLGSRKLQTHEPIPSLPPAAMTDWSQIQQSKPVEPVSFNPWISCIELITI